MEKSFWQQRWLDNEIAFHNSEAHPLLVEHIASLTLNRNERVFVPLCGKTLDIKWLLLQGFQVCGVELVESAVLELFADLAIDYKVSRTGHLKHFSADDIDIFSGDIFDLDQPTLGHVDAVYDRAAMVALPDSMRDDYITHVLKISNQSKQLLISFEYDTSKMDGPPFSHSEKEIKHYYQQFNSIEQLTSEQLAEGLKGHAATEFVWLLSN